MSNEAPAVNYRALLEDERASLEHQLTELGFGKVGDAGLDYDSNFADSSQVTAERSETEALVNELRGSLREVDKALERIAQGSYGICERCGQPITDARLEAVPMVTTCIVCASNSR